MSTVSSGSAMRIERSNSEDAAIEFAPNFVFRPPSNNKLCQPCKGIFRGSLGLHCDQVPDVNSEIVRQVGMIFKKISLPDQQLHASLEELDNCSCSLCQVFSSQLSSLERARWRTAELNDKNRPSSSSTTIFWRVESIFRDKIKLSIFRLNHGSNPTPFTLVQRIPETALIQSEPPPDKLMETEDTSVVESMADAMMVRVHEWMSQCLNSHAACEGPTTSWIPNRLIHVGDEDTPPCIRLRESVKHSAKYVTLSHCWGQTPTLRLLQDNLTSFQTGLPMGRMPRTYRDAIILVRQLGWEYLWIDSLCILQDDDDDWRAECTDMHLIFQNAICNISASQAEDSEGGLFNERNPEHLEPPTVYSEWTNWTNGNFVCINPQHIWSRGVSKSTLNSRGWVLQEHALSRRTIHFGRHMVFWECPTKCASEAEPDGLMTREAGKIPLAKLMTERMDALEIWRDLLGRYTASSLTYEKDKLVAIAGAAKRIQEMASKKYPGITYCAGLWSQYLAQQLLWQVPSNPSTAASKPSRYRAPSWSWASIDGEIAPGTCSAEYERWCLINAIDARVTPAGPDPFLEVSDAVLSLTGWLWKATQVQEGGVTLYLWYDDGTQLCNSIRDTNNTYFLPISGCIPKPTAEGNFAQILTSGLLLEQCPYQAGYFQRIGMFYVLSYTEVYRALSAPVFDEPETELCGCFGRKKSRVKMGSHAVFANLAEYY
ncbi:hypothetical protein jhhlp_008828 [Lomentospora prolificans]|uniref:Heterokaryon incompatibility domain-containing protein n=1 Tax=Lomentospora prolificans TaxID=41688 RepID=A0A2N3MZ56_9PEZI|nr:hypothetical protein jhhlp_008828 [Lomentospora prolificans]